MEKVGVWRCPGPYAEWMPNIRDRARRLGVGIVNNPQRAERLNENAAQRVGVFSLDFVLAQLPAAPVGYEVQPAVQSSWVGPSAPVQLPFETV